MDNLAFWLSSSSLSEEESESIASSKEVTDVIESEELLQLKLGLESSLLKFFDRLKGDHLP
jgi:hypothetical protein